MSFPGKSLALLLVPPAALITFMSLPLWYPDGTTQEALQETLLQEKGFQLTGLGFGYKTTEISFNDPQTDYQHRILLCDADAPTGCEDTHLQIAGPRAVQKMDRMAVGTFSDAQKELFGYLRKAVKKAERPRDGWKAIADLYRLVTKRHM